MTVVEGRNRVPDRHERLTSVGLVGTLVCAAILFTLVVGCVKEPKAVPTATTAPTPTLAVTTPTPTPSPTVVVTNPLQRSLLALGQASSFRVKRLFLEAVPGVSATIVLTQEFSSEYLVGPSKREHVVSSYSDGIEKEFICVGSDCWSRTGQHPWTQLYKAYDFLWQRRINLDDMTVVGTEVLTASGETVVDWRRPIAGGAGSSTEHVMTGRTWLQTDTYLPSRELIDFRDMDGTLVWHSEETYYDYGAPVVIEAPVVATVTPVPTVPVVERTPIATRQEKTAFPGVLFVPEGPGSFPAVIVLHGSEGGTLYTRGVAQQFAEAGYVALALCYFGCPDTPSALQDINVEGVMDAVDYLKNREDVRPGAIALVGYSRGAELALVVGTLDPDVRAVVSFAGSPRVSSGYPTGGTAWLYQGKPLPFLLIPVEQINGPVLVIHGERDNLWPVGHSYRIVDRLEAHGHAYELAVYPRAHHILTAYPDALRRAMAFLERELP